MWDLFLTGIGYNQDKKVEIAYIGDKKTIDRWHNKYIAKKENLLSYNEYRKAEQLGIKGVMTIEDKRTNVNAMIEDMRFEL